MDPSVLARKQLTELKSIASHLEMRGYQRLKKAELIEAIVRAAGSDGTPDNEPSGKGKGTQLDLESASDGNGSGGKSRAGGDEDAQAEDAEGRTRVRTRTRERTAEERDDAGSDTGDGTARVRVRERSAAGDGDGDDGDQGTRARQRSRGRGGDERNDDTSPDKSVESAAVKEPKEDDGGGGGTEQDDGGERGKRDQDDRGQANRQGGGPDGGQGGGDDAGSRKRRSRRERRRNKGGGGGGGQQQGRQQQGRPQDDDPHAEPGEVRAGVLDVLPEGYGFLRTSGYLPGDKDVYISQSLIRKHGLRRGDVIEGPIRQQKSSEKVPALHHVQKVNGVAPDENGHLPHRPDFKDMTPLFPDERLRLETPGGPISMRIVDLMSPIGKGQRGLIVSPPKAGKTTILKELGQAIAHNDPDVHVMVVLVDERPEEVTDMERSVPGEIIASTFDRPADDHTQIAELAIERAKRMVEQGRDVVILLDSITRLSRAYNLAAPASGRIMSGGVDSTALYPPKRFFGAARNIEHGGSLTIIATALIETGSKMDEVIFEEFKGTGNMELRLDRRMEQKRIFPAIDIEASGTRKEELLLDKEELTIIWKLRRVLHALEGPGALELLIDKMKATESNNRFLIQIQKSNLQT
jgi:transcription termination factor Rho